MNFIRKVFENNIDEEVHLQFQKYGKGEFKDKALVKVKTTGGRYTIVTSAEFANGFVRIMAEKLGEEKTKVTGAIISTNDLTECLDFKDKKQFQGVKRYIIENEMSGEKIITLLDKLPKAVFAFSFEFGENKLKVKPKSPKLSKSKNKDNTPKPDFCRFITKDKEVAKSFVFEDSNFKEANINHMFIIDEIVIPEELKQEKDFAKVREKAKRKGKIVREANIDGNVVKEEKEFVA